MGYHRAGFQVTGVDVNPQKRYPFQFIQGDALSFPLDGYDFIHASPPCQDHSRACRNTYGTGWMLAAIRERLIANGKPWVIENVPGAPMRVDFELCGCQFGLPGLRRRRWFETSWGAGDMVLLPAHDHSSRLITVYGHDDPKWYRELYGRTTREQRNAAMGIDWMTQNELCEAIPPEFTDFIGRQFLRKLLTLPPNRHDRDHE